MNKEKVFGFVKKEKKKRDEEVGKKSMIISLIIFAALGILSIMDNVTRLEFFESFIINALVQWIMFMLTVCGIIFIVYIFSQLSTKQYKLKEIKK